MSVISRLFGGEPRAQYGPDDDFWYRPLPAMTAAGVRVDQHTAMKLSAVWRCASIVAGSVAMLPLVMYRRTADGDKQRDPNHPLYAVLHDQPNRLQTAMEWREQMMVSLLFRGNAYSQIVAGPRGFADQLWPIPADAVEPKLQPDRTVKYRVRMENGQTQTMFDDEMLHIRGLSFDGVSGLDVISYFASTVGLGLSMEQFAGRFFSQAPTPGAIAEHPGTLSPEAQDRLRDQILKRVSGEKAGSVLVLEEGMKYTPMNPGLTAEQAQIIAAREFTIQDIARWFGVPNHLVGETTKETSWGSGIEEMGIGFVRFTLKFWLTRFEQAISRDLILARDKYYAEFVLEELLQADTLKRFQAYAIALGNKPFMTQNEVRGLENRNRIEGGDMLDAPEPSAAAPQPSRNGIAPANAYAPLVTGGHDHA